MRLHKSGWQALGAAWVFPLGSCGIASESKLPLSHAEIQSDVWSNPRRTRGERGVAHSALIFSSIASLVPSLLTVSGSWYFTLPKRHTPPVPSRQ